MLSSKQIQTLFDKSFNYSQLQAFADCMGISLSRAIGESIRRQTGKPLPEGFDYIDLADAPATFESPTWGKFEDYRVFEELQDEGPYDSGHGFDSLELARIYVQSRQETPFGQSTMFRIISPDGRVVG